MTMKYFDDNSELILEVTRIDGDTVWIKGTVYLCDKTILRDFEERQLGVGDTLTLTGLATIQDLLTV